jgi:hypothetical protein
MKKLLLTLLFGTLGITNTFASFPVTDTLPVTENINTIEVVETENTTIQSAKKDTPFGNWSLILGLTYFPLFVIGALMVWDGPELAGGVLMLASIAAFIASIITGIISLIRKEKPKWKAIIGLGLTLGVLILSFVSNLRIG